jgi:arsenate reductase (thioredoxin)
MIHNDSRKPAVTLLQELRGTVEKLIKGFNNIPDDRKDLLSRLSGFINGKVSEEQAINLVFICTHNSRRSHMAQLWAQAAAHFYQVPGVTSYSGGTEATAFSPRAVEAMNNAGFQITPISHDSNAVYEVKISEESPALKVFSKKYNDPGNPTDNFAAIMTCSHADANCPIVYGAAKRLAITYDDPKDFDGTDVEKQKYRERAEQIGREMLYVFSKVKRRQPR